MKYVLSINGKDCLLTHEQLDSILTVLDGVDTHEEKHVGQEKGTQGYNNAYVPIVKSRPIHEWLTIRVMHDDLIETIKLRMKLEEKEES